MINNNIYSIGYGNRNIKDFVNLLTRYKIFSIIDIRSYPISRFQPAYNKARFQSLLEEEGIKYIFMGRELGGKPKAAIFYTPSGKLNYELVMTTKNYQDAIGELIALAHVSENICLMCSELNANHCHRKIMVGHSLYKQGVIVNHINGRGQIEKHTYDHNSIRLF